MEENHVKKTSGINEHRYLWVDVLKGLAILTVVYGHNAADKAFVYCFHMPLFFLLAGFLFSPKPIMVYIHRSILRLLVPYMSFLLLLCTEQLIFKMLHNDLGGG